MILGVGHVFTWRPCGVMINKPYPSEPLMDENLRGTHLHSWIQQVNSSLPVLWYLAAVHFLYHIPNASLARCGMPIIESSREWRYYYQPILLQGRRVWPQSGIKKLADAGVCIVGFSNTYSFNNIINMISGLKRRKESGVEHCKSNNVEIALRQQYI